MTFIIGLTGSIGMGKSTTARVFAEEGCAVWDADAAVHRLYSKGGDAVVPMGQEFPEAIIDGEVRREKLKSIIADDATALRRIEQIVHPLVASDRASFLSKNKDQIIVLDIPLLFETGADERMDAVVVVSVGPDEQRRRVMERGTMSSEQFEAILAKQVPDAVKREKADYVIITDTPEHAREQVRAVLAEIRDKTHA